MKNNKHYARLIKKLDGIFGRGQIISIGVILVVGLLIGIGTLLYMYFATPNTITIASGPKGSAFERNAEKYKKILAREGVTLKIVPSGGSMDNFTKLSNPKVAVDVGFVLGGEVSDGNTGDLMSLGSISYQPLMIFYRGVPKTLLSDFKGKRLYIGQEGSGAHTLALALLKANGIEPGGDTTLISTPSDNLTADLEKNRVDAIFLMGDSTSIDTMRDLLHMEDVHLFSFSQADGYSRRIPYLNKLTLPRGAIDFGKDIPAEDVNLVAPTVELIARDNLHPALSDLLLEAAREVHGTPGLFKKRGEFPAPQEHVFRISPDASRYYTSGKSYLYRTFPFEIANFIARIIAFIVPIALLLIPALKLAPRVYRWQIESRIYRWYRALLDLEREASQPPLDPKRRDEILRQLDHIETTVSKIFVPASFGDLFYGLRGHICFVRNSLESHPPVPEPAAADEEQPQAASADQAAT